MPPPHKKRKIKRKPFNSDMEIEPDSRKRYRENVEDSMSEDQIVKKTEHMVDKIEEQLKKKSKINEDEADIMPLTGEFVTSYKSVIDETAAKQDKLYYRDKVFHEDEQKEKTEFLRENDDIYRLEGLNETPGDPGFHPAIMPQHSGPVKHPFASVTSEKDGLTTFVYPFTWDQIGNDWTIVVMGKRRSGKSCFIKSLCGNRLRPFFPRVVVFTKTKCAGEYSKFVPEAHIHVGLDEEILQAYFDLQKKYKEAKKRGKFHGNMSLLIIIDDCLSDGFKYKKVIDEAFFEGRHLDICFIISTQDTKGISPACSGNTDLAVCFAMRQERDKEAVRTKFFDFFKNDKEMDKLFESVVSKKWHTIMADQHTPHRDPRFTIYGGRAPNPPPFVMGCAAWWKDNVNQLETIVIENAPDLNYLLKTTEWGVIGEDEFNQVLKYV